MGACLPPTMEQLIAKYLRHHAQTQDGEAYETFEEADDFEEDTDDLLDFETRYTLRELAEEELLDPQPPPEAPQETIATQEGPNPSSKEETPSGASS